MYTTCAYCTRKQVLWVTPTSAVPKLARFLMSAARTWVCPTKLAVTTTPLVLTVATVVLEDVQTYMPLPPDGCREQQNRESVQKTWKSVIDTVLCKNTIKWPGPGLKPGMAWLGVQSNNYQATHVPLNTDSHTRNLGLLHISQQAKSSILTNSFTLQQQWKLRWFILCQWPAVRTQDLFLSKGKCKPYCTCV